MTRFSVLAALHRSLVVRGVVAVALGLSLVLGSMGAGSVASAAEPASASSPDAMFFGYVFVETPGTLPERVRAVGPSGVMCGGADVARVSDYAGFYVLSVTLSDRKRGCPSQGAMVQFLLSSGRLDDGEWAAQLATVEWHETPRLLNLHVAPGIIPNWLGTPGNTDNGSVLRWTGQRHSLSAALAALPFSAGAVFRLDPVQGIFVAVTPSVDTMLETGDVVMVGFR